MSVFYLVWNPFQRAKNLNKDFDHLLKTSRLGRAGEGRQQPPKLPVFFLVRPQCKGKPHPSSFDQLPSEFFGGVVERELLTAQVVDWRVALQVEEKVVVKKHLLWLLLSQKNKQERRFFFLVFQQWQAGKQVFLATRRHLPALACFTTWHKKKLNGWTR